MDRGCRYVNQYHYDRPDSDIAGRKGLRIEYLLDYTVLADARVYNEVACGGAAYIGEDKNNLADNTGAD